MNNEIKYYILMNEVTSAVEDTLINIFLFQTTEAFLRDKTARVQKLKADNTSIDESIVRSANDMVYNKNQNVILIH